MFIDLLIMAAVAFVVCWLFVWGVFNVDFMAQLVGR